MLSLNCMQNVWEFLELKKIVLPLESKANDMKIKLDKVKNSTCNKCETLE